MGQAVNTPLAGKFPALERSQANKIDVSDNDCGAGSPLLSRHASGHMPRSRVRGAPSAAVIW
eukprot:6204293-Pleurochrysis_carterae.AAC.2